ncbi:MAG: NAD(+) kinase [Gammaproteobacteria bacterium]
MKFKKIAIIGRIQNPGMAETLETLLSLLDARGIDITVEEETAQLLATKPKKFAPRESIGQNADLVIVVGGDGSLLSAAHSVVNHNVPILGINRGNLGFLTDIHPTELKTKLTEILDGQYQEEERFLLDVTLDPASNGQSHNHALNEIALLPKELPHLVEFEVFIDDAFVCSQRADGILVATPTGSTAYSLSAGGPILQPNLDAMVLVPMFSHTLSIRPIVIHADSRVTIHLSPSNTVPMMISCDSQHHLPARANDTIQIQRKKETLTLIHPKSHDFYSTLRTKLHWGAKPPVTR